ERLPLISARAAAINPQLSLGRIVFAVALDGDDVNGLRLMGVDVDHEPEVGGQIPADLVPRVASVVAAHHVPVLLHEQHARARRVHRDVVNAVPDLSSRFGDVFRMQAAVDGSPGLATVVGAECARRRNGDEDPVRVAGIQDDAMQAHSTGTGLPFGACLVAAQSGEFMPGQPAVGRTEQGGIFDSRIDRVGIGERRLKMPDPLELPGMLRPVVELMRGQGFAGLRRSVVGEFVARASPRHRARPGRCAASGYLPGLAAVVGSLEHLPEPAAGLRSIQPVRIRGRTLDMVDLPSREIRAADIPLFTLSVRLQHERSLVCAYQYSYFAHPRSFLPDSRVVTTY